MNAELGAVGSRPRPSSRIPVMKAMAELGHGLPGVRLPPRLHEHRLEAASAALSRSRQRAATKAGRIPGNKVDPVRRLVQRATLGWTLAEQEAAETLGANAWLERQLDPESIDDFGLEVALEEALPSLKMSPWERLLAYDGQEVLLFLELLLAQILRAAYSPRQLYERMVIFWTDHFNIDIASDFGIYFKPTDDREVVRRHALGKFSDLLEASARSAAMSSYLDNDSNIVGHANENYARELMELHTLGVDGGYTEADVKEVARCFTGLGYQSYEYGPGFGSFAFRAELHDQGPKRVLGVDLPAAGGLDDANTVLELLAEHPSTGRFLATKMLRYLWGYQPQPGDVAAVAAVYATTGGDIAAMVRECLRPRRMATATPKVKRPFHLLISTLRALFAGIEDAGPTIGMLALAGHVPFTWSPPNGFPDAEGYWAGLLLPRWTFGSALANPASLGWQLDLPFLDPANYPAEVAPAVLAEIAELLLAPTPLPLATRESILGLLAESPSLELADVGRALGLVVASPAFQRY